MTNLEFHGYPEDNDEIKWSTWTPKVEEGPQQTEKSSSSDVENASWKENAAAPEVMSEEEAAEMVDNFLKDPETSSALSNLRVIEEKYKAGSLPANMEARYKKAKEQAKLKLKENKYFQQALEQAWVKIDGLSLSDYSVEGAQYEVEKILWNPATKEQIDLAKNVIIKNYNKLDPKQQKSLEEGLKVFKDSIKNAANEIWIDQ